MSYQEWLFRDSTSILAASSAAGLTGQEAEMTNGLAMLTAKHKQLVNMPKQDGVEEFGKLNKKVQKALTAYFGNTKYNPAPVAKEEDQNIFGKIVSGLGDVAGGALDALGSYGEALSNVYRTARTYDTDKSFMENWDSSWDGRKLFDEDIEAKINEAYDPTVRKIAKKFAIGKTYGEILSSLHTEEEFKAFQRFQKGDAEFQNAIRDYDNARISWGRDIAHLFNLEPDVGATDQGVEGTIYKWVSGSFDIAGDIAFDPMTYLATPLKAIQGARYGLTAMLAAEKAAQGAAALSRGQRIISKLPGVKLGVDAAFDSPKVAKMFDDAGALIKTSVTKGASKSAKADALVKLQDLNPFFDQMTVSELAKAKVFDANSARSFFKNSDAVEAILVGRPGELARQLPRYKATQEVKKTFSNVTRTIIGYEKNAAKFAPLADNTLSMLEKGDSVTGVLGADIKKMRGAGDRFARWFDRAMIDNRVYIGGQDELGRSMRIKSTGTIYTMARSVLPKYHARMIAAAYGSAKDEATARRIITGLYDTIADSMGIQRTGVHKAQYERAMRSFKNPAYGENMAVGKDVQKLFGGTKSPGRINPSEANNQSYAIAEHHLARQAIVPNIGELVRILDKKPFLQGLSNGINGNFVTTMTDAWSALNLLPRLGMRSVLDENLFHYLTIPLVVLPKAIKGYQASITRRIITRPGARTKMGLNVLKEKDIGVLARVTQKFFVNLSPDDAKKALSSRAYAAKMMEEQLKFGRIKGLVMGSQDAKYLAEHVKYGHSRELENFSSGMNQSVNNGIPLNKQFDTTMENLNVNVEAAQRELGTTLTGEPIIVSKTTPDFQVNFLVQLNNRVDRNGMIGKLAVQHMDNPTKAVKAIEDYLKTAEGKKIFSRFERSSFESEAIAARNMYLHVRSLFQDDLGNLNKKLLDKVRVKDGKGWKVDATQIGIDDLEEVADMLPIEVLGYKALTPAYKSLGDTIAAIFDRGFQIADRQVATLTREPVFNGYYLHYRRGLASAEDAYVQKLMKTGMSEPLAKSAAAERYAFIGNELAMNRTLGFVDNPNVRSNLAYSGRNLARYYRANEDFYRRAIRATSPETLVRLRMTAEGLDDAGFIHEDENGDKYFFFPVDEIAYNMYAPVIRAMTGNDPMRVMPLSLTGKIKMLTPSLDPESSMPTFSGPLMAVGYNLGIKPFIPSEWQNNAERTMFGPYAENRSLGEALIPSSMRKALEVYQSTLDRGISTQVHSAAMKSAAYYTSMGMAPDATSSAAERQMFSYNVQATARNIVAIRNLLGIFSPVSPGIATSNDVPAELFDEGVTNFKSEFNNLVEAEYKKRSQGAYERALRKWTKVNPGRLVYTVSETETNKVASVQKTKQAVTWMQQNEELIKAHPEASLFLVPQTPGFDMTAYAYLKAEGFLNYKPLEDYFEQIATVKAETEYRALKDKTAKQVAGAAVDSHAQWLAQQGEISRKEFLKDKPYLRKALEKRSGTQIKLDTVRDLRDMLDNPLTPKNGTTKIMRKMLKEFDYAYGILQTTNSQSDGMIQYRSAVKSDALRIMQEIAGNNPNAKLLYNDIFERLLS